jgi:hypothetical protein
MESFVNYLSGSYRIHESEPGSSGSSNSFNLDKAKDASKLAALCFIGLQKFRSKGTIFCYLQKDVAKMIGQLVFNSFRDIVWQHAIICLKKQSFLKVSNIITKIAYMEFDTTRFPVNVVKVTKKNRKRGTKVNTYNFQRWSDRCYSTYGPHRHTNEDKKISKRQFYLSNNNKRKN